MLFCKNLLLKILDNAKILNSRNFLFSLQKLYFNYLNVAYVHDQKNITSMRLLSSWKQRTLICMCYSMRNCHSSVKDVDKTSATDQNICLQKTSQDELKEQVPDEKIKIFFETSKGKRIECLACINQNVMNASIENDIAMHGNCSGEAICSICHVYVDEKYQEYFPKISEEEAEMLDMVPNLQENSRLSCQIIVRKELEGAVFKLPHYNLPSYGLIDDS